MLEAVRVRKEGFAYRPYFSDFVRDYRNIAFKFTDTVLSCMRTDSHAVYHYVIIVVSYYRM